jgi:hypothetical protein
VKPQINCGLPRLVPVDPASANLLLVAFAVIVSHVAVTPPQCAGPVSRPVTIVDDGLEEAL